MVYCGGSPGGAIFALRPNKEGVNQILKNEPFLPIDIARAREMAEGKALGVRETAKNFLRYGVDIAIVMSATGLTQEDIAKLQSEQTA
jgi:hypothetical protein